jgi:hypothetical protein
VTAQPSGTPQRGVSDTELLHAIANGSEASFEELRGRHGRAVARLCRMVAGPDGEGSEQEVEVGHFMVDLSGGCRVRFNLPANHSWSRFWVSEPGDATAIVAST